MQPRSEEFRAQAAECEELAKRNDGLIKQQYEQLADQWLFLAEQAETLNRRTGSRLGHRTMSNQRTVAAEESQRGRWAPDIKSRLIVREAVLLCALQNWR
jgi:hypothetical protein